VGSFVSRADAMKAADVSIHALKKWILRGWINADGVREKVRTSGLTVEINDVLRAELDTRRKTQRSHRRLAA
jgi:hypothetical protein